MTTRYYSSTAAETTLSGTINSSATSITIGSAVGLPGLTPFTLALDYEGASEELVEVTAIVGTTATITRAIDGTSATGHTAGARVRHVSSARDFSDSREHENADDGIHGLAPGDVLVGASKVQALTNKTISASTWSAGTISGSIAGTPTFTGAVALTGGGTLTGTFAGNPTFSGNPEFTGTVTTSGLVQSERANATDVVLAAIYGAFVNDTFRLLANGRIEIGPGTGARDTFLYRSAANTLKTDGAFLAVGNITAGTMNSGDVTSSATVSATTVTATTINGTTINAGTAKNSVSNISYLPMQTGSVTANFSSDSNVSVAVVFATAYPSAPNVVISKSNAPGGSSPVVVSAINTTTTGFTAFFNTVSGTTTTTGLTANWHAAGQA